MISARVARPSRAFFILKHLIDVLYEITCVLEWRPRRLPSPSSLL